MNQRQVQQDVQQHVQLQRNPSDMHATCAHEPTTCPTTRPTLSESNGYAHHMCSQTNTFNINRSNNRSNNDPTTNPTTDPPGNPTKNEMDPP